MSDQADIDVIDFLSNQCPRIHLCAETWTSISPDGVYGDKGKAFSSHPNYENADIYFIARTKKLRFDVTNTRVGLDGRIRTRVIVGAPPSGRIAPVCIDPITLETKLVPGGDSNPANFFHVLKPRGVALRVADWLGKLLVNRDFLPAFGWRLMHWAYGRDLSVKHNDAYSISIERPATDAAIKEHVEDRESDRRYGERMPVTLSVEKVVKLYGLDVGPQNIVYIGKTARGPLRRLDAHYRLSAEMAKLLKSDEYTVVVHYFRFSRKFMHGFIEDGSPSFASQPPEDITRAACEAELINHFKPRLNEKFLNEKYRPEWEHIKELKKLGYKSLAVTIDTESTMNRFTSDYLESPGSEVINLSVNLQLNERT